MHNIITALCLSLMATTVTAQETLTKKPDFLAAVAGHVLEIGLLRVQLQVLESGEITGKAFGRGVTGTWDWRDGFFCRSMTWGDRELEYNCQQVKKEGASLIFTSDKGGGRSATFSLRPATQ
jgi:hypothetical protein